MENLSEAEAKDEILKLLISQPDATFEASDIKQELFPDIDVDVIRHLMEKIINTVDPIVKTMNDEHYIQATGLTKHYLEVQGGFSASEKREQESHETDSAKERLQDRDICSYG